MRIAICDDDEFFRERFTGVVKEWDPAQCPECFSSGAELLKAAVEAVGGVLTSCFWISIFQERMVLMWLRVFERYRRRRALCF